MAAGEDVYEQLLAGLLTGTYPTGSRLREEVLAASLGTSRTPIRQALQRLHAEGLVEIQPNRGALVTEYSDREVDQIFELRAMLEGYAAREAAAHISSEQADALAAVADQMERRLEVGGDADISEISQLNLQFHRSVHSASGNRLLGVLLTGVIRLPLVIHSFRNYSPDEMRRSLAHHREIAAAIAAGESAWAESVMHSHVHAAHASLRRARAAAADLRSDINANS